MTRASEATAGLIDKTRQHPYASIAAGTNPEKWASMRLTATPGREASGSAEGNAVEQAAPTQISQPAVPDSHGSTYGAAVQIEDTSSSRHWWWRHKRKAGETRPTGADISCNPCCPGLDLA